jgi:hypothetical protein
MGCYKYTWLHSMGWVGGVCVVLRVYELYQLCIYVPVFMYKSSSYIHSHVLCVLLRVIISLNVIFAF